jgi:hypothetical protein
MIQVSNQVAIERVELNYKSRLFEIEYFVRPGTHPETILFIHGLGGAKENFWTSTMHPKLKAYTLICFDNPGTGSSSYYADMPLNVDDLAELTNQFVKTLRLNRIHLVGASMGGLIAMLLLERYGTDNILDLINIEGNLMPEDCMFSSKVVVHDQDCFEKQVYFNLIREMRKSSNPGYRIIANNLQLNTNISSYYHYSFQTVEYSGSGALLEGFLNLPIRKQFIYGDENKSLSYLSRLSTSIDSLVQIEESNHFVFYDNPYQMYDTIAEFINQK